MPRLVYLEIPVDHPDAGKRPTHVFKLNRALYGTTDAPKLWNDELWATLKEMGYLRTKSDWNLFYKDKSFIVFHVDDGILSASDATAALASIGAPDERAHQRYRGKKLFFAATQQDNFSLSRRNQIQVCGLNIGEILAWPGLYQTV